jgi:glucose dehydrogenase
MQSIIVDGVLYGTSPLMKLFAVNAATGKEKWQFNPFDSLSGDRKSFFILNNCRGITLLERWQRRSTHLLYCRLLLA